MVEGFALHSRSPGVYRGNSDPFAKEASHEENK